MNTLPLEEYLYGVVPSEMPASYDKEALKAQADLAPERTPVCRCRKARCDYLGAQVDDSVAYQVYQNGGEAAEANAAVDETKERSWKAMVSRSPPIISPHPAEKPARMRCGRFPLLPPT